MGRLLSISEAAKLLGVPKASFRTAAEKHGMLVRMGRSVLFDPDDTKRLISICQDQAKEPDSTGGKTPTNGSYSTAKSSVEQGLQIAEKLKRDLR